MKTVLAITIAFFSFMNASIAGATDDREMSKGTVLNYTIKEGAVSYKLKVTVIEWSEYDNIKLQWQTSGGKISKGTCTFSANALDYATEIKIKLKAGDEILKDKTTRWFLGYEDYDYLHNSGIETDLTIDSKFITLFPNEDETEKDILYNNVKTEMDYSEGSNTSDKTTIGFVEYAEKIILLEKYVNGNFSMTLVSIVTPVTKTAEKLEDKVAKQILDAMAPKGKVPLKKMEPVKFASVRSKYPLLATIEDFDATKNGTVTKPITETYEYRYGTSSPNPPSLVDCFTADLKIIYNQRTNFGLLDMTETISTKSLPSAAAKRLMEVYLAKDYNSLPGYRPWTHWSFVRSLTESQRTQLASELEGYIAMYGFSE